MAVRRNGQSTARCAPWAAPSAYVKQKDGGRSRPRARYEGGKLDVAQEGQMVERIRVGSWNVGSMSGRSGELVETLGRRKVDFCCVQETRWKGGTARWMGPEGRRYKFLWQGKGDGTAGVGILVAEKWAQCIIGVDRLSERLLIIRFLMNSRIVHFVSAYAPQAGRSDDEKDAFWDHLTFSLAAVPRRDFLLIGGDLNGHVGETAQGYEGVHGGHGYGARNSEGLRILEFADAMDMVLCNTYFQKPLQKLITYSSGGVSSLIDYILVRKEDKSAVMNVKSFPGEECVSQHHLLVADIMFKRVTLRKRKFFPKLRVWRLRQSPFRSRFQEDLIEHKEVDCAKGLEDKWNALKNLLCETTAKVCGWTKGAARRKETWWWSPNVDAAVKEKRRCFKVWSQEKTEENRVAYQRAKRASRFAVWKAKEKKRQEIAERVENEEGKKNVFKMVKQMAKEGQDISAMPCIRNVDGNIASGEEEVRNVWKTYMEDLLNNENEWDGRMKCDKVEGPCRQIELSEVATAMNAMKHGKAPGPSRVSSEMLEACKDSSVRWLTDLCNLILCEERIPSDWTSSILVPLYKGKGDPLNCGSYRAVKFLEHAMKIFERVIERRIRSQISLDSMQFGFVSGRGTTDAIFVVRQLCEKFSAKNRQLFFAFVDLEKAFDRIPREVIWWSLRKSGVEEWMVRVVMSMYQDAKTFVRTSMGDTQSFGVGVGVHQGSVLSPLLFAIVMDAAVKDARQGLPFELLYADDLVLMAPSLSELRNKLAKWKECLSSKGLKINVAKSKVMRSGDKEHDRVSGMNVRWPCGVCGKGVGVNSLRCTSCNKWVHRKCSGLKGNLNKCASTFKCRKCLNGDSTTTTSQRHVDLDGENIELVNHFTYLGDVLDKDGGVESAVTARIRSGWFKFKELSAFLTSKAPSLRVKGKVYAACVRQTMVYGCETWALRADHEQRLMRTEMRMVRWMSGRSLRERERNDDLRRKMGIESISDIIRRRRLRWFGHVLRREETDWLRRVMSYEVQGKRPRGRPKKTWRETVAADLRKLRLREEDAKDRTKWKAAINRRSSNPAVPGRNGRKRDE